MDNKECGQTIERVYTGVVGPILVMSLSASHYFVMLMDEHSGISHVRLVGRKNQAADSVKEMRAESENMFPANLTKLVVMNRPGLKWLRSDGGSEYLCNRLQSWLKEKGIVHELTTPYSRESNGKSERLNSTLLDMARCMMLNVNSEKANQLWAEAINMES